MDEAFDPEAYLGAVLLQPADRKEHGHREYLGSILALGLSRSKIGDIVPGGAHAWVIAFSPIARHIQENLTRVSNTGVRCTAALLEEILPARREKTSVYHSVSSLRADSVAAPFSAFARGCGQGDRGRPVLC
jgi:RNA-binding protein YlmH